MRDISNTPIVVAAGHQGPVSTRHHGKMDPIR